MKQIPLWIKAGTTVLVLFLVVYVIAYNSGRRAERATHAAEVLNYNENMKKLTAELTQAQLVQRATQSEIHDQLDSLRAYYSTRSNEVIDSLRQRIVALSVGHGTVSVRDSGIALNGHYQDAWLSLNVTPDTTARKYSIAYMFTFGLHDVSVTTQNDSGVRREIYSVFLQSLEDTSKIIYLGDYERTLYTVAPTTRLAEKGWSWQTSFMFGANYSFKEHGSLFAFGLNTAEYSTDKGEPKGTVLKLPTVEFTTDFVRRFEPGLGAGLNIGHWLPVFEDLYVNGTVGYNIASDRATYQVGISTTL